MPLVPTSLDPKQHVQNFGLEDLLYTRSDPRGVIAAGNENFRKVAALEWADVINAPHKILRHDMMPKALFGLLWAGLKQNKRMGAYVLNRASDGRHYWVFAVMSPIDDGYVSVRLKPSSDQVQKMAEIYSRLRAAEAQDGYTVEDGVAQLRAEINDLGYANYLDFAARSLSIEVQARQAGCKRAPVPALSYLDRIQKGLTEIQDEVEVINRLFKRSRQIPYNMRLQAGRLEGSEGPISVVSSNHRLITQNLTEHLHHFEHEAKMGGDPMRDTQFKVASAIVMQEITSQLRPADPRHEDWARRERDILGALRADYLKAAADQITSLARNLSQFARISHSFRRALSGLEMTRIMCEIERVKLTGDTAGLDEITDQLKHTEQEMSAAMERIETIVAHLSTAAHDLKQKGIADRQGEAA